MKTILLSFLFFIIFNVSSQSGTPGTVTLYPNPASTQVNIKFNTPAESEVIVTISDILGNKIETLKFEKGANISIDLAALQLKNGLYLFKVENADEVYLKRLVIRN